MVGVAASVAYPTEPQAAPAPSISKTVVGVIDPALVGRAQSAGAGWPPEPPRQSNIGQTMIGVAPPIAYPAPARSATAPSPGIGPRDVEPPRPGTQPLGHQAAPETGPRGTSIGVAQPGIAPLKPGVEKKRGRAPGNAAAAKRQLNKPLDRPLPPVVPASRGSFVAMLALGGALLLLGLGVAVALLMKDSHSVQASVELRSDGKEQLRLVCL
jgi:hypothetical protein